MAQEGILLRAFVASPSDVQLERKIVPEVIHAWNAINSLRCGVVIEPVKWETHALPGLDGHPQMMINDQLLDYCDIMIGVFWTRLGTKTQNASSGTVEEIEYFRKAGKPVLLYFSKRPVVPDSVDHEQYAALVAFRSEMEQAGLVARYSDEHDFRELLANHLALAVQKLLVTSNSGKRSPRNESDFVAQESNEIRDARKFIADFGNFVRRVTAEWESERLSETHSIDGAKYVLAAAASETLGFGAMVQHDPENKLRQPLTLLAAEMKRLTNHQLFLDGGKSWSEFWESGAEIMKRLEAMDRFVQNELIREANAALAETTMKN